MQLSHFFIASFLPVDLLKHILKSSQIIVSVSVAGPLKSLQCSLNGLFQANPVQVITCSHVSVTYLACFETVLIYLIPLVVLQSSDSIYMTGSLDGSISLQAVGSDSAALLAAAICLKCSHIHQGCTATKRFDWE